MDHGINIDRTGERVDELPARVVAGPDGKPRLEPLSGQSARWYVVLRRHEGKGLLRLAISRVSERRSLAQNRLLWGVVYPQLLDGLRELALSVGETCPFRDTEELHAAMKHRFLGRTVTRFLGEEWEHDPTTTTLSVEQFSVFIRQVTEWGATKGVYVEMPEAS